MEINKNCFLNKMTQFSVGNTPWNMLRFIT